MSKIGLCFAFCAMLFAHCSPAEAQQAKKYFRVGVLSSRLGPLPTREGVFEETLLKLGYVEGRSITIEYRYAEEKLDRLPELTAELVGSKVDVLVAVSTPAIEAAKKATKTIPIIMAGVSDPVGTGFVASLARPGGNVTGLSLQSPELSGKRLELLKEIIPKLSRVAFLVHGRDPGHPLFVKEAQDAGNNLGIQIQPWAVTSHEEIESTFPAMVRERTGGLVIQPIFVSSHGRRIADLATRNRLPTISDPVEFVDAGGLTSYGPNRSVVWRRTAVYVDKILRGAKPSDLPVEQPTKFEFVINLKTAKQIGLTIPPNVLARADRVIR
ncbi:MAG TPA: ABC transporter substrate-binding protein [Blastocatellia bacterium]|nr:ABC transporter substrate-binding protein [Blastocatellia bacterium]